jgi:hypothetical protein
MLLSYAPKSGHFSIGAGKPPVNNLSAMVPEGASNFELAANDSDA